MHRRWLDWYSSRNHDGRATSRNLNQIASGQGGGRRQLCLAHLRSLRSVAVCLYPTSRCPPEHAIDPWQIGRRFHQKQDQDDRLMANSDLSGAVCARQLKNLPGTTVAPPNDACTSARKRPRTRDPHAAAGPASPKRGTTGGPLVTDLGNTSLAARQLQEPATSCRPLGAQDPRSLGRKEFRVYSGPLHEMAGLTEGPRMDCWIRGHWMRPTKSKVIVYAHRNVKLSTHSSRSVCSSVRGSLDREAVRDLHILCLHIRIHLRCPSEPCQSPIPPDKDRKLYK